MRSKIIILLFPFLLLACKPSVCMLTGVAPQSAIDNADESIIENNNSGFDTRINKYAYISEYFSGKPINMLEIKDGLFILKSKVEKPRLASIRVGKSVTLAVLEEGNISLDMERDYVAGTPMNDVLNTFKDELKVMDADFREEVDKVLADFSLSQEEMDRIILQLEEKTTSIWKGIIKSYIDKYPEHEPLQRWWKDFL